MGIHTTIPQGWGGETIWPDPAAQLASTRRVVGPGRAHLDVLDEPEASGYDLGIDVALVAGRYIVTHLEVFACHANDVTDTVVRLSRQMSGDDLFVPSANGPTVTPRGLAAIRLPPLILRGLYKPNVVEVVRSTDRGEVVGVGTEDELPVTYVLAWAVGDEPTKAVAERFGLSRGAAAQRVARARRAGLIPPTTGSR